jgi:hypothetical protein
MLDSAGLSCSWAESFLPLGSADILTRMQPEWREYQEAAAAHFRELQPCA